MYYLQPLETQQNDTFMGWNLNLQPLEWRPDSIASILIRLPIGRPRNYGSIPWRSERYSSSQSYPPSFLFSEYRRIFPLGIKLTTQHPLLMRLKNSEALPLLIYMLPCHTQGLLFAEYVASVTTFSYITMYERLHVLRYLGGMWKAEVKDYYKLSWHLSACAEEKQWIPGLLYLFIMNM